MQNTEDNAEGVDLERSTFILSLKRPVRKSANPPDVKEAINELPGVQIKGGDPLSGFEVSIPDNLIKDVRERVGRFAHVEVYEDLSLDNPTGIQNADIRGRK